MRLLKAFVLLCLLAPLASFALPACADLLALPDDPMLVPLSSAESSCVDLPVKPLRETALVRIHACDFSRNCAVPVTGLLGVLCAKLDPECAAPVLQGIFDINGDMAFEVPTGGVQGKGFDGFLHLKMPLARCTDEAAFGVGAGKVCSFLPGCDPTHPDEKCIIPTYLDALVFFNPPITNDQTVPIAVPLVATAALPGLQMASGARMPELSSGIALVTVLDCHGVPVPDAIIDYDDSSQGASSIVYISDGALTPTGSTDMTGFGAIIGVAPGYRTLSARRIGTKVEQGSARVSVAPFAFTYVNVVLSSHK